MPKKNHIPLLHNILFPLQPHLRLLPRRRQTPRRQQVIPSHHFRPNKTLLDIAMNRPRRLHRRRSLSHPSPKVPPPAARKSPPPPRSAAPARHLVCAAPPRCPTCPLRHPPRSAHTTPAAPTKTKNPQSTFSPPASTPARATPFPPPHAPCTFPAPPSQSPESGRVFSSNPCPRVPAAV